MALYTEIWGMLPSDNEDRIIDAAWKSEFLSSAVIFTATDDLAIKTSALVQQIAMFNVSPIHDRVLNYQANATLEDLLKMVQTEYKGRQILLVTYFSQLAALSSTIQEASLIYKNPEKKFNTGEVISLQRPSPKRRLRRHVPQPNVPVNASLRANRLIAAPNTV